MNIIKLFIITAAVSLTGCSPSEPRPVDIFPEDNCSSCRMAISEPSFASEIIDDAGEIYKFDDLGCLENFRKNSPALRIGAMFVMDYDSRTWIPYEKSTIVRTGIKTPMGSGKVAFGTPEGAVTFEAEHPPELTASGGHGCCERKAD